MKKVLLVSGLLVSMSGFAQSVTWVTKPRTHDTIGYINLAAHELVITHDLTPDEFNRVVSTYKGVVDIKFGDKSYAYELDTPEVTIANPIQPYTDTTSSGAYLVLAGRYKNAAIGVGVGTSIIVGAILANPSSTIADYNAKATLAGVLSVIGGAVSFSLNIAGNNMLIKAGLAKR